MSSCLPVGRSVLPAGGIPSLFLLCLVPLRPDDQKEKEDQQLQEAYDGLFPKLRIIKDLFFNDEARDILYKTLQATTRTFGRPVQMPTVPLKLYTDLQVTDI